MADLLLLQGVTLGRIKIIGQIKEKTDREVTNNFELMEYLPMAMPHVQITYVSLGEVCQNMSLKMSLKSKLWSGGRGTDR